MDVNRLRRRLQPLLAPCLALVLSALLSACGSRPVEVAQPDEDDAVPSVTPLAAERPMVPAPQGAGYYKDDGPHKMIPGNLDEMPDARPRIEPIYPPSLRPYTVMGQRFVPRTSLSEPYRERGHASWYGRKFHGRLTAIGEVYDMYEMTAAHPTLPLPSYVRVTNIANGRSVIVRVNDRGPFLRGRLIDLSYAAAHRLGYINAGSALVDVELLTHDTITAMLRTMPPEADTQVVAAVTQPAGGAGDEAAYLQLGAFSTRDNAAKLMLRVREEFEMLAEQVHLFNDDGRYRLQIGPFDSVAEARSAAGRIVMLLDVQPYLVMR